MMILSRKFVYSGGTKYRPILAETLDPTYSAVYFFMYPAVMAGFVHLRDAIEYVEAKRSAQPTDPGIWSVIQTGEIY